MTWLYWIDKTPQDRSLRAEVVAAISRNHEFIAECRSLKVDLLLYERRHSLARHAEADFLEAGGAFGYFASGHWVETVVVEPQFSNYIDALTMLRLHALRALEARAAARLVAAEKERLKANRG